MLYIVGFFNEFTFITIIRDAVYFSLCQLNKQSSSLLLEWWGYLLQQQYINEPIVSVHVTTVRNDQD